MDFQKILMDALYLVIVTLLPVTVRYVAAFVNAKVQECAAHIENEKLQSYVEAAVQAIGVAVISTSQTYVDELKKSGQFDKEAQQKARNMAIAMAKTLITEDSKKAIETLYTDYNTYLELQIEAIVRDTKIEI